MSILYKLTDRDHYTRRKRSGETLWGEGVTHVASGKGELCGPGFIHAYESPLVAVFMNPAHAMIDAPVMWECEGEVATRDGQFKCGCASLTTVRVVPAPALTAEVLARAFIYLAQARPLCETWTQWSARWLSGEDRSVRSAESQTDVSFAENFSAWTAWRSAAKKAPDPVRWNWDSVEVPKRMAEAGAELAERYNLDLHAIVERAMHEEEALAGVAK